MKIGLVGGTFDPIHVGHLLLGEWAAETFGLDEVWFLPAGMPYFKEGQKVSSREDRLAMTQLAAETLPGAKVCDVELKREGRTYTWETVRELNEAYPDDAFFFIFGEDCLNQLATWRYPERILKGCTLVAAMRGGGSDKAALEDKAAQLMERFGGQILVMAFPQLEISSTMIRRRAAEGKPLRYLVPPAVEKYIRTHHLYE